MYIRSTSSSVLSLVVPRVSAEGGPGGAAGVAVTVVDNGPSPISLVASTLKYQVCPVVRRWKSVLNDVDALLEEGVTMREM